MEIINRKARHDYTIEEEYEAGISLTGTEIKSIRLGKMNIKIVMLSLKMKKYIFWMLIYLATNKEIFLIIMKQEQESY